MSNEINFDSIGCGKVLVVALDGDIEASMEVTVKQATNIRTRDMSEVPSYLVEDRSGFRFMVGEGEIVEIVK